MPLAVSRTGAAPGCLQAACSLLQTQPGPECFWATAENREAGLGFPLRARVCVWWPFPTSLAMHGANRVAVGARQLDLTMLLGAGSLIPPKTYFLIF